MNALQAIPMLPVEDAAKLRGKEPLPSRPYYDPEWWELERQAIFMRTWLHIGHVCELPEPGSFVRRELEFARASLLIVRGKDGAVRAFHNVCTHRGTQLVDESAGKRDRFSCPYHMWTFGTGGELISAPDFERFYVEKKDCALKQVACEIMAGLIFVNLAREPEESLLDFFGPIAKALELLPVAKATSFSEYTYEIAANWKTNFDNFQENYHLRFVHPRTSAGACTEDNPFGYPIEYGFHGPHRSQTLPPNFDASFVREGMAEAGMRTAKLAQKDGWTYAKVDFKCFPAFHVVGLAPTLFTHTMFPLGPDRTRGSVRLYCAEPNDSATRLYTREFGQMTIRDVLCEDRDAIVSAQKGLGAGAVSHIHFQDHEMLPRHLYELVQEKVAKFQAERDLA